MQYKNKYSTPRYRLVVRFVSGSSIIPPSSLPNVAHLTCTPVSTKPFSPLILLAWGL